MNYVKVIALFPNQILSKIITTILTFYFGIIEKKKSLIFTKVEK